VLFLVLILVLVEEVGLWFMYLHMVYSVIEIIKMKKLTFLLMISCVSLAQEGPQIIPMTWQQQLTMENISLRQEILRLQICISHNVPESECGPLQPNGVIRIAKQEK